MKKISIIDYKIIIQQFLHYFLVFNSEQRAETIPFSCVFGGALPESDCILIYNVDKFNEKHIAIGVDYVKIIPFIKSIYIANGNVQE